MSPRSRTILSLLGASVIAAFFLRFAGWSLHLYFSPDDCMNLYRSWNNSAASLLKANLLFFLNSPFYRPFVSFWYRCMYDLAGFNPVPFHISMFIVLGVNVWLTYAVVRRLTGSRSAGAIAALLISYHPAFGQLYFDTGYAYDIICYFFFFAAFLLYLRTRQQKRAFHGREWIAFFGLFICALNSKEIAITLPVFMALYELLYGSVPLTSPPKFGRWLRGEGRLLVTATLVTVLFVLGRGLDHRYSLLSIKAYQPVFTWAQFMETSETFLNSLFVTRHPLGAEAVLAIWMAMLIAALVTRSRTLLFAWLFLMISPIPIAFIFPRGAAQYYVPLFGWVLYSAALVDLCAAYAWKLLSGPPAPVLYALRSSVLFIAIVLVLTHYYRRPWAKDLAWHFEEPDLHQSVVEQLHQLRPELRRGSRVLFLDDPYTPDDGYRMLYLMALSYHDATIQVERAKRMPHPLTQEQIASYDYVFDYRLGRFFGFAQPRPQGPEPVLEFEWGQPAVFHYADFTRVTPHSPAHPGETVIAKVKDLGQTMPAIASGQPFPRDPLVNVVSPVSVRVGGQPVDVIRKLGWPDRVNTYRVDFCIPKYVQAGDVSIEITASGVRGPAVMVPVD